MKKLLFVAVAFAGLTLVSCNKDQGAVNKLEGTWTVTKLEQTSGGVSYDPIANGDFTQTMTFNKCKLKTDEWCTMSYTQTIGGIGLTENDWYRVTGDGTTFEVKDEDTSSTVTTSTINELTKTTAMMTTNVDANTTIVTEATKN